MNQLETEQLNDLEEQSNFYIELNKIFNIDPSKISITDGYDFVKENDKIFERYSILTLKTKFKENKKFKKVLKIINSDSFDTYMQAITLQLLKNEKENHVKEIEDEKESNQKKVDEILSLTKQQEIIINKAKQLEETIEYLKIEIENYRVITKKQSDNLVKNVGLIEENDSLKEKEEKLMKLGREFNKLIKEGKKLNIILDVHNSKGLVKFNSTAIDATNNFTVITPTPLFSENLDSGISASIIKAGDSRKVEPFKLKQIETDGNENLEKGSKNEVFQEMLDHITRLEFENAELLSQNQEKNDFEVIISNLKKDHQEELDEISQELDTVLSKKDTEIKNAVMEALNRVHKVHSNTLINRLEGEKKD